MGSQSSKDETVVVQSGQENSATTIFANTYLDCLMFLVILIVSFCIGRALFNKYRKHLQNAIRREIVNAPALP